MENSSTRGLAQKLVSVSKENVRNSAGRKTPAYLSRSRMTWQSLNPSRKNWLNRENHSESKIAKVFQEMKKSRARMARWPKIHPLRDSTPAQWMKMEICGEKFLQNNTHSDITFTTGNILTPKHTPHNYIQLHFLDDNCATGQYHPLSKHKITTKLFYSNYR